MLQQENPDLRGKPVGVIKDKGRTCIIAASKEAKKLGVKTGCNVKEAKILAPHIILVPAEFDIYLDATKKLKKIFENITPDAEIFSLDEAFIPLKTLKYIYPNPHKLAIKTKLTIKEVLGEWITCNIGIAKNRLLAKIASEIAPKDSIFEINEQNEEEILKTVNFSDVCGVGFKLEARLKELGVEHPYQIRTIPTDLLETKFGLFLAEALIQIGRGEGSYILDRSSAAHMKSVSRTITLFKLCGNETQIKSVLYNLAEEVTYKVRRMDMAGRQVGFFLQGEEKTISAHRTLKQYIRHTNEMVEIIEDLYKNRKRTFRVIKFGVFLSYLKPLKEVPPTLFSEWYKNEKLYKSLDAISQKYGLFTVRSGLLTQVKDIIRPEVTGYLGDKKYQFMEE